MKYIIWRWTKGIAGYWQTVARFSVFFTYFLAVRLLVKTLFWPWKRDLVFSQTQGFNPKEWFNRHLFNAFSRLLGLIIRLTTILAWLVWEIIWWLAAIIFFPVWILSPIAIVLLTVGAIFVGEVHELPLHDQNIFLIIGSIISIIFLIFLEILTFKARRLSRQIEVDPKKPNPNDLWFNSMCSHLLVDQETLRDAWMDEKLKNVLISAHLSRTEFDKITLWEIARQKEYAKSRCWWLEENLFQKHPLTESWVFGWTFTLNNFSRNLLNFAKDSLAIINAKELEILKNSLAEADGINIVIVGEPGIGKKRLVENLVLDLDQRNVPTKIIGKKILELRLDNLLASSSNEEDKIYLLEKVLLEVCSSGNIILFIPTLHNYLETQFEEGQIGMVNISSILTNFLENTGIQIITCSSQQELDILFKNYPSLAKYFRIIQLQEPDMEDCLLLLCEKSRQMENKHQKLIPYNTVKRALEISIRYSQEIAMPQRALDFIEQAVNYLKNKNPQNHIIKETDIEYFASKKFNSPIGKLGIEEKKQLANIEEEMKSQIIGQIEAIEAVASALRRRRLDLSNPERPAGCFLFLGPTGVGKTHTAEVLAKLYYGGEDRMARLDMSEYQGADGITKLLGDASSEIEGYFHKILSVNPFCLILLDELEKANNEVRQLLLQIAEEGIAKTGNGKKLNFRETIIIATSNAEAILIQELVKKNENYKTLKKTVIDKIQQDRIFSPELLNRFDEIIVFHPLKQEELLQIADLALKDLKKRLQNKEIIIDYDKYFTQKLAQTGFDPVFGARELRRIMEKQVENSIAKDLLSGKIKKGEKFKLPIEYLEE